MDDKKKDRAKQYEEKLSIEGDLDEVLKVSVPEPEEEKQSEKEK